MTRIAPINLEHATDATRPLLEGCLLYTSDAADE